MSYVQDSLDRLSRLASDRLPWERLWIETARYVLPNAERFDRMFATSGGALTAVDTVVSTPIAAERSPDVYDQTSILAVIRGAAGEQSLVTPQTSYWHGLGIDDPFGPEPTDEEQRWLDASRNYMFAARGNPRSGFWAAHKACLRCKWGFGTAVMLVEESPAASVMTPIVYSYVPLSENHLATDHQGVVDTNYRVFTLSARQCVQRWPGRMSAKVAEMAGDPKRKDQPVTILHAVQPRAEAGSYGSSNRGSKFSSCYIEVGEKHLIVEGGFFEFPYRIDHWERNSTMPYEEGPVSLCLAEIKSLNEMSFNELMASGQSVSPPIISHQDTDGIRLDVNPRAVNPGYMSADGRPLAAALVTAPRPDFAQAVIEARRNTVRSCLYLDLWQTIIDTARNRDITAYQAALMAQEKADALGPIGTSSQTGLYFMVERELGILDRLGAFSQRSPLALPKSLADQNIGAKFTSPLDKLRKLGEAQAATQVVLSAAQMEGIRPGSFDKIAVDDYLDYLQDTYGAPRLIMTDDQTLAEVRGARAEAANAQAAAEDAARTAATVQATGASADVLASNPNATRVLEQLAGVAA